MKTKTPKAKQSAEQQRLPPLRAARGSAKPCAQNCPKCGATDIHREHREHGESVDKQCLDDLCNDKRPYLIGDWPYGYIAGKEHIGHHCRTCGYEWQTDVLPNAGTEARRD